MRRHGSQERRTRRVRCAIYTRKSTDENLDNGFNSLDAQREAAEAYVASQRHEGWLALPARYDDGGFSGGSMERPALLRLLEDVEAGRTDCVVVYKVDRLSRSLLDFAKIIETFDRRGVFFVSVTQQFNTTTSMGRLTLNILLSFAQFEREIIGERIRDKVAATKRKGKYCGDMPVLGWPTDQSTKPILVDDLAAAISEGSVIIHSPGLVDECLTFVTTESGSQQAQEGKYDDRVMALGIAWQARKRGAARGTTQRPEGW